MRIISGNHKGRRLIAPDDLPARPTTDFAKEALFNILRNHYEFEDLNVLDIFAGTGNISFEFAAREARSVISVDNHQGCIQFIKKTAEKLDFSHIQAIRSDAMLFLQKVIDNFDVIFADPPYNFEQTTTIYDIVFERELLKKGGVLIIEHSVRTSFAEYPNLVDSRKYGSVCFSFFKKN